MSSPTQFKYVVGGTVPKDSPSYVIRSSDEELFQGLLAGELCYVLTSRQMGKSSTTVRVGERLKENGIAVTGFELTKFGNVDAEHWYSGIFDSIGIDLELDKEFEDFWEANESLPPLRRLMAGLEKALLPNMPGQVVIFLDEIDCVRSLPFSTDDFFASIRELYNRRAQHPELSRITFCLLGVVSPTELISDSRMTPFNVGRRVQLKDFQLNEASVLTQGLPAATVDKQAVLDRIMYWTGGQPYLTQLLFKAVAASGAPDTAVVDGLVSELFLSDEARDRDENLLFVRNSTLKAYDAKYSGQERDEKVATLLATYEKVRRGRFIDANRKSEYVDLLLLSGLVKAVDGRLRVRNRIYERSFDLRWIAESMPNAELSRARAVYRVRLLALSGAVLVLLLLIGYSWRQQQLRNEAYLKENQAFKELNQAYLELKQTKSQVVLKDKEIASANEKLLTESVREQTTSIKQLRLEVQSQKTEASLAKVTAAAQVEHANEQAKTARTLAENQRETLARMCTDMSAHVTGLEQIAYARKALATTTSKAEQAVLKKRLNVIWPEDQPLLEANLGNRYPQDTGGKATDAVWNSKGDRLLIAKDSQISVCDLRTGSTLAVFGRHNQKADAVDTSDTGAARSIWISPNDRFCVANMAWGYGIYTIQGETYMPIKEFVKEENDDGGLTIACFDSTSRYLLLGFNSGKVIEWDLNTTRDRPIVSQSGAIVSLMFVPNQPQFIVLRNAPRKDNLGRTVRERLAFDDDLGSSNQNSAELINLSDGQPVARYTLDLPICSVQTDPSGKYLVTSGTDYSAVIWDIQTARKLAVLELDSSVNYACFSHNGKYLITCSQYMARLWNTEAVLSGLKIPLLAYPTFAFEDSDGFAVAKAEFSSDDTVVVTDDDGAVRAWSTLSGEPLTARLHSNGLHTFALDKKGLFIARTDGQGIVSVYGTSSPKVSLLYDSPYSDMFSQLLTGVQITEKGELKKTDPQEFMESTLLNGLWAAAQPSHPVLASPDLGRCSTGYLLKALTELDYSDDRALSAIYAKELSQRKLSVEERKEVKSAVENDRSRSADRWAEKVEFAGSRSEKISDYSRAISAAGKDQDTSKWLVARAGLYAQMAQEQSDQEVTKRMYAKALDDYDAAIQKNPTDQDSLEAYQALLGQIGNHEQQIAVCKKLLALPDVTRYHRYLELANAYKASEGYKGEKVALGHANELLPNGVEALKSLVEVCSNQNEYQEAKKWADLLSSDYPDDGPSAELEGMANYRLGNLKEAATWFKKALTHEKELTSEAANAYVESDIEIHDYAGAIAAIAPFVPDNPLDYNDQEDDVSRATVCALYFFFHLTIDDKHKQALIKGLEDADKIDLSTINNTSLLTEFLVPYRCSLDVNEPASLTGKTAQLFLRCEKINNSFKEKASIGDQVAFSRDTALAKYRLGDYDGAWKTLDATSGLEGKLPSDDHRLLPYISALRALILNKLGRKSEASSALKVAREGISNVSFAQNDPGYLNWMDRAEISTLIKEAESDGVAG